MIWKIKRLKNRYARRMRVKRYVWQERLRATLTDFKEDFRKNPTTRFNIKIIRVNNKTSLKIKWRKD